MSENRHLMPQEQEPPVQASFHLGRSSRLGGLTLLISLALDFLLNGSFTNLGGQTGLWLAAIATIAAFVEATPIIEEIEELAPVRYLASRKREVPKGELPHWKRALGMTEQESLPVEEEGDDAVPLLPQEEDDPQAEEPFIPTFALSPAAVPVSAEQERGERYHLVVRATDPRREILLAEMFGIDIDDLIDAGVFISGMKGSGKSTVAARLMEQVGRFGAIPQVIFDVKGDFTSLVDSHFARGVIATQGRLVRPQVILAERLQVVVDLRPFTMEQRAQIIARMCATLLKEMMAREAAARFPWFVHVDEAQQYAAQARPDGITIETWRAVVTNLTNLGVLGRAYGAVPCLYTQRIADINKSVISQQELRIFLKATLHTDIARYHDYLNPEVASDEMIRSFGVGEGIVIVPDGRQFLTHFLNRESRHGSHTPHLDEALHTSAGSFRPSAPASAPLPPFPQQAHAEAREVTWEANGRGNMHSCAPEEDEQIRTIAALRDIGKRLRRGEDAASIVKSFGLPYGRATQEMHAVVEMVNATLHDEGR